MFFFEGNLNNYKNKSTIKTLEVNIQRKKQQNYKNLTMKLKFHTQNKHIYTLGN